MIRAPGPARILLIAALVLAMPLCCCRGQTWASILLRVGASGTGLVATAVGGDAGAMSPHCSSMASDAGVRAETCHDDAPGPCDDGPCDCGQDRVVKGLPDAPTALPVGLQIGAVAPASAIAVGPAGPHSGALRPAPGAVPRPPSTLLRLHCALIV